MIDDLIHVVQELSLARDLPAVQDIVRRAARRLVGADGATFVLRDGSLCFYADEDAIAPLWKGKRFPMEICISGWVMLQREPAVIADIYADQRIPHDAYRQTFVRSLAMVPIRTFDPIGAIGAYWATPHEPTPFEVHILRALADSTAVILESVRLWEELEERVRTRTSELAATNLQLEAEIAERERAEEQARRMSITDELTGTHNRRGFLALTQAARAATPRSSESGLVVFCDVDGLKEVNDTLGHEAGDRMLVAAAEVITSCFRDGDIVARMGGDEFAVFVPRSSDDGLDVARRIEAAEAERNRSGDLPAWLRMSIGMVPVPPDSPATLDDLLKRADAVMYEQKRTRRGPRDLMVIRCDDG